MGSSLGLQTPLFPLTPPEWLRCYSSARSIICSSDTQFLHPQGEYIAPEKVENIYAQCKYVAQAYLYGDSLKSACVALIVPDEEVLMPWAAEQGLSKTFKELCDSEVRVWLARRVVWQRGEGVAS